MGGDARSASCGSGSAPSTVLPQIHRACCAGCSPSALMPPQNISAPASYERKAPKRCGLRPNASDAFVRLRSDQRVRAFCSGVGTRLSFGRAARREAVLQERHTWGHFSNKACGLSGKPIVWIKENNLCLLSSAESLTAPLVSVFFTFCQGRTNEFQGCVIKECRGSQNSALLYTKNISLFSRQQPTQYIVEFGIALAESTLFPLLQICNETAIRVLLLIGIQIPYDPQA